MDKTCAFCDTENDKQKLFCCSCGKIQEIELGNKLSIFSLFELENSINVDKQKLDEKYAKLIGLMHPDKFIYSIKDEKEIAEKNTATINKTYSILSSEIEICKYIINEQYEENNNEILQDENDSLTEEMDLYEVLNSVDSMSQCTNFRKKLNELYSVRLIDLRKNIAQQSWRTANRSLQKLMFIQKLIESLENKAYMLETDAKVHKR